MAAPHRIDVVLLHQAEVLDHPFAGHHLAQLRIPFVAVDTADEHRPAVDQKPAVLRLCRAESDPPGNDLHHLPGGVFCGQEERVELRGFGGPLARVRHRLRQLKHHRSLPRRRANSAGRSAAPGQRRAEKLAPRRIDQRGLDRHRLRRPGIAFHLGADLEHRIAKVRVEPGPDLEIPDEGRRRGPEIDVAEDPAQPPHVLVLQIRSVVPAEDLDRQQVLARLQMRREPKGRRGAAVLAEAELLPVQPEVEEGVDALEGQKDFAALPRRRHAEGPPVGGDRIIFRGDEWRIGGLPRIVDVRVDRDAEALDLDVGRHRDPLPARVVESRLPEVGDAVRRPGDVRDLPFAIERSVKRRFVRPQFRGGRRVGIPDHRGGWRLGALGKAALVLPLGGAWISDKIHGGQAAGPGQQKCGEQSPGGFLARVHDGEWWLHNAPDPGPGLDRG